MFTHNTRHMLAQVAKRLVIPSCSTTGPSLHQTTTVTTTPARIPFYVWDNFLSGLGQEDLMKSLTEKVFEMEEKQELKHVLSQVAFRTDKVKWITYNTSKKNININNNNNNNHDQQHHQMTSLNCFDQYMHIMTELQTNLFSAMNDLYSTEQYHHIQSISEKKPMEVMVSCYPSNSAHYDRHIDDAYGKFDRIVTCVYYISNHVTEEEVRPVGGHLRLFTPSKIAVDDYVDVAPIKDRLVLFSSRDTPHEVRPAFHKRYALSMWLYGKQELTAMQKQRLEAYKQRSSIAGRGVH